MSTSVIIVGAKKEPFDRSNPSRGEIPVKRVPPKTMLPGDRLTMSAILCKCRSEMTVPMLDWGFRAWYRKRVRMCLQYRKSNPYYLRCVW